VCVCVNSINNLIKFGIVFSNCRFFERLRIGNGQMVRYESAAAQKCAISNWLLSCCCCCCCCSGETKTKPAINCKVPFLTALSWHTKKKKAQEQQQQQLVWHAVRATEWEKQNASQWVARGGGERDRVWIDDSSFCMWVTVNVFL